MLETSGDTGRVVIMITTRAQPHSRRVVGEVGLADDHNRSLLNAKGCRCIGALRHQERHRHPGR
ncbi:MAG: hypothetical protein P8P20_15860, partial [Acidimicrobiales bacterium]|nr:hypothetical protein [Acidimicrobiales bacterium]